MLLWTDQVLMCVRQGSRQTCGLCWWIELANKQSCFLLVVGGTTGIFFKPHMFDYFRLESCCIFFFIDMALADICCMNWHDSCFIYLVGFPSSSQKNERIKADKLGGQKGGFLIQRSPPPLFIWSCPLQTVKRSSGRSIVHLGSKGVNIISVWRSQE